ncbi:carbohydrate ABC transporter permease [Butyrivibrio sp. MC2013]|uniref:carbohydrate ABC transporter permease n=1 Tax=Butyrivibrio sp. MC2013 TaxID=1280686 RepID=UPI00047CB9FE|nr:carbohydrate ABC transporter permease [Butyrivibrio sp. MC2013]
MNKYKVRIRLTLPAMSRLLWSIVRAVIVFGICFVILYPLYLKLSVSFMDEKDLYDATVHYVPKNFTLDNYKRVLAGLEYGRAFINTLALSALVSGLQLFACMLTAYGFARFYFPGKNLLFACVIFTLIVPPQIVMLPMFMNFRFFDLFGLFKRAMGHSLNLIDTPWPLIIQAMTCMGFKNGLYIYMLRQYFKGLPKELEEAAFVDGCGRFRTFIQIMLPSSVPMMVTVFLFGFVWQWTDSFYVGMYLPKACLFSNQLSSLAQVMARQYQNMSGSMNFVSPGFASMVNNTGSILIMLPLIILYLFCQSYFVEGIERSGIVG